MAFLKEENGVCFRQVTIEDAYNLAQYECRNSRCNGLTLSRENDVYKMDYLFLVEQRYCPMSRLVHLDQLHSQP
jgi:hypothetical protein